jgi:hypothetical protein
MLESITTAIPKGDLYVEAARPWDRRNFYSTESAP